MAAMWRCSHEAKRTWVSEERIIRSRRRLLEDASEGFGKVEGPTVSAVDVLRERREKLQTLVLWADVIDHGDVRVVRQPCFQAGVRCLSEEGVNDVTVGSEDERRPVPSC